MSDNLALYLSSSQALLKAMSTYFRLYDINAQINHIQSQVTDLIKSHESISSSVEILDLLTELIKLNKQKERNNTQVNISLVESISILLKMIDNLLLSTNANSTELQVCQKHLHSICEFVLSCQIHDFVTIYADMSRVMNSCYDKKNPYWDNIAISISKLLNLADSSLKP